MLLLLLLLWADPKAADLLRQGLLAMQSGQLQQAENSLLQASKLEGTNPLIWASLAETRRRLQQPAPALEAAGRAEQLGAKDPAVAHALAIFYTAMNRPEKAAPLEQTFAESPKADPEARLRAAELFRNAGQFTRAADLARQAVQQHDTPEAEDTLGQSLAAAGDTQQALPHLQKAWELSGRKDSQLAFDYAQALLRDQSFAQAADVATSVFQTKPDDPQWELILGVARYGQRRFDEAIAAFLKTVALDPSIPQPYLFLGNLLEQAGPQIDQVIAAEESWAKREPANAKAQLTLAKALLQKDRKSERAKALLEQSIALQPNDWEAYYQLGVMLETARDFSNAAGRFERAIALNPNQALAHYHLARVYDRLGDTGKATREREIHQQLSAAPPAKPAAR